MAARSCSLSVARTTALTALLAAGALVGLRARRPLLTAGAIRTASRPSARSLGLAAFSAVIFAAPLGSPPLFRARRRSSSALAAGSSPSAR